MPYLNLKKIIYKNEILDILKNISNEILQADQNTLLNGIWLMLDKYRTKNFNYSEENTYYKQFNSFLQCINILKDNV